MKATANRARSGVPRFRREGGFTGIELPIVVSFLAVFIGILVPALQTIWEAANRPDPCATPPEQVETEPVELKGELTAFAVADPNGETFRYKLGAGKNVVGVGLETKNEWHLFGSGSGLGELAEPLQVVSGFHLVGSSEAIRGTVLPGKLTAFFTFDKDFTLLNVAILEAEVVNPCA
jgi:hypothetical protein